VSPRESGSFIPTKYPTVGIEQLPILRTSHFQFDISLSLASDKCVPSTLAYDYIPYWYLNGACPSFLIQPASDRDDPIRTICLNWRHWHWQNDKTGSDHANCSSCGTLHPRYSRAIRCFTGGIQLVIQLLKPPLVTVNMRQIWDSQSTPTTTVCWFGWQMWTAI
jgi:hypothetical protein